MAVDEKKSAINDVIYLASCAVNEVIPDASIVESMDLDDVYKAAQSQFLIGITASALESAGKKDPRFTQALTKIIRKSIIMQADMEELAGCLNKAGIWYLPLKGSQIADLYPSVGMRQMSDRDILIDSTRADDVRTIMEELGFSVEQFGESIHDIYYKKPVSNFEIHRQLFRKVGNEALYDYYKDVKKRLIRDDENSSGYHFRDEDAYIYMIAHEYKHYAGTGIGLRSLLDTYVYCSRLGNAMDWDYIKAETEKLGIDNFEKTNRELAAKVFSKAKTDSCTGNGFSVPESEMFGYMIDSGTYGNIDSMVSYKVGRLGGGRKGKIKYLLNRIFISMDTVKELFPFFYKHKILMPLLIVYRLYMAIAFNRKKFFGEMKALKKDK